LIVAVGTYIQWPPEAAIRMQRSVSSGWGASPRFPKSARNPPTLRKTAVRTAILPDHTFRTRVVNVGNPAYEPPTTHSNSRGNHRGLPEGHVTLYLPPVPTTSVSTNGRESSRSQSWSATSSSSRKAVYFVVTASTPRLRVADAPRSRSFSTTVTQPNICSNRRASASLLSTARITACGGNRWC